MSVTLTDKERAALLAYVRRGSYKEAAMIVGLAESTLRVRLHIAMQRNHVDSVTALAVKAYPLLKNDYVIDHTGEGED